MSKQYSKMILPTNN